MLKKIAPHQCAGILLPMKKYEGNYDTFESPVRSWSLSKIQKLIEQSGGYDHNDRHSDFESYTTAWINEYSLIGRMTANYYFSLSYRVWIRTRNARTLYRSWDTAWLPIRAVAQWYLRVSGYKAQQDKKDKEVVERMVNENDQRDSSVNS